MPFNYDKLVALYDGSVSDLVVHIEDELSAWTDEYGTDFDGFTAVYSTYTYEEAMYLLANAG